MSARLVMLIVLVAFELAMCLCDVVREVYVADDSERMLGLGGFHLVAHPPRLGNGVEDVPPFHLADDGFHVNA